MVNIKLYLMSFFIKINGEDEHIHVLFSAPPQVELAKLIKE